MTASLVLLDPTSERSPVARALAVRPPSLHGLAVAVLDISKARGNVFLDSGSSPALRAIRVLGTGAPIRGLRISDNLFVGTGSGAVSVDNAEAPQLRDNIAIHPTIGAGLLRKPISPEPFSLKRVSGAETAGNMVVQPPAMADGLAAAIRRLASKHDVPAKEILSEVRRKLAEQQAK